MIRIVLTAILSLETLTGIVMLTERDLRRTGFKCVIVGIVCLLLVLFF